MGDTSLLEMLYLDSEDPQKVADEFDIPLDIAEKLVERDKQLKKILWKQHLPLMIKQNYTASRKTSGRQKRL